MPLPAWSRAQALMVDLTDVSVNRSPGVIAQAQVVDEALS
jgi:hypothetical protein